MEEIPVVMVLPLPTTIPQSYGLESTSGPNGCFIQCRGTKNEREKISKAAAKIGLSYGTFMRRVVNDAAEFIHRELPDEPDTDTES
ncbi:MAG: hypothetical protein IM561_09015 [Microcystis sp. M60BS1]|uniref:hypothetical protein n=1 Tax=unclassified Microcystis TaxID=2643300 RepID=UPI00257F7247|nr:MULTISPECIES: hypothetical protein [unclassified Microcystis]MCA2594368.1 hypothetical protein [Microcystis sp. M38BS1]MCA6581508.1 hypothetical protein [Pseudanabaena sp. M34BS1SP1A06MG]MCA2510509.1 hypothetical protein [Microcystis sp. M60BS1]MCA2555743.1 hypothetical protein [Microcystis sp. M43BS1]MCA2603428.1 hypothetical protein [Microcystis sp. M26BS1]